MVPVGARGGAGGSGAGILCDLLVVLTLTNDTLASNTPGAGGPGGPTGWPPLPPGAQGPSGNGSLDVAANSPAGNVTAYNTILVDSVAGTLDAHLPRNQRPSSNNLIGTGGSGGLTNGTNGNIVGVDPKLGPLADNGGPTQTMALLAGSPAIDAGSNALALAAGLTTDQRGYGRVFNGTVDIGAYEFRSSIPGDINGDGTVSFADLLTLAQHYGSTNATWVQGDLNGDGSVGFDDLLLLAQNYGKKTTAAAFAEINSVSDSLRLRTRQGHR